MTHQENLELIQTESEARVRELEARERLHWTAQSLYAIGDQLDKYDGFVLFLLASFVIGALVKIFGC